MVQTVSTEHNVGRKKAHLFSFVCSINLYEENKKTLFLSYGFDEFAAMSFPDADEHHLETCINFFFWAFSVNKSAFKKQATR